MRILFALPGLHRYDRGAEIAFISVATQLANAGDTVTLIGSGEQRAGAPYRFLHAGSMRRENFESFPSLPALRGEYGYEDLSFLPGLLSRYRPQDYDVTITCNYPFCNWALRRPVFGRSRPPHVYVTQNGDWPAQSNQSEYRFFGCEGLVCTNPQYYDRNKERWCCALIPNGVNCDRFVVNASRGRAFGIPENRLVVLMVSALIPSKRVDAGIEAVSLVPNSHLVVAGDGPMRQTIEARAAELMPDRFTRLSVPAAQMPQLYQSADVFLHMSLDEPFGNVYLEAMASGLPVVAHDWERSRWIVGDDEFLADAGKPAEIARQIVSASQCPSDRRVARAGKAAAFSWQNISARYRQFLQEVVARK